MQITDYGLLNRRALNRVGWVAAIVVLLGAATPGHSTRYAGDFEELGVSARAVGMGSAFVAQGVDPAALYYNPAAPAMIGQRGAMLMHAENFGGLVKNDFASVVLPSAKQTFGLGVLHNGVSGIKLTMLPRPDLPVGEEYADTTVTGSDTTVVTKVNAPQESTVVSAADWVAYFNYARPISEHFLVGGNAKLIYRTTGASTCFGLGVDLGALVVLTRDLNVGLRVRNLTTSPLFWDTKTRESMDPRPVLGITKGFGLGKDHRFSISAEVEGNFEGLPIEQNLGAEYRFKNMLSGRIGFRRGNLTLGLGGEYKRFFLDYAYETAAYAESRDLPSTQKIAGGIQF